MGKAKYIILNLETGETVLNNDGKTFLFNSEKDARVYLRSDEELNAEYNDGYFQIQEIIL